MKKMRFVHEVVAALLLSLVCFVQATAQQQQSSPSSDDVAARVDKLVGGAEGADRFSGAILVARDGKVILSKGYGMANLEFDAPNTPQTKFRLGSITKQFTAAAVMLLHERGKLGAQDSVCKYVEPCPAAWQPVTLHHLLTHTSGIASFTGTPDYRKTITLPTTPTETVARFRDLPLEFAPGGKWNYSNSGYVLLGHIVEKVSGKSYEEFLRENIFEPLKMSNTGYDAAGKVLKNRASGYARTAAGEEKVNAPYIDMTIPHGAGALYSTVEDMYLWDQALHGGKLFSPKTLDLMLTPALNNYAYGVGIGKQYGLRRVSHGGAINGFNSMLARFPEERATIIILSNVERTNTSRLATQIARAILSRQDRLAHHR